MNGKRKVIIAIHQPNFFPWLGFFDKIIKSDIFILMDNVQFPKGDGTWTNRVKIMVSEKPQWITVPVIRSGQGNQLIHEMKSRSDTPWRKKIVSTILANYARHPYYHELDNFIIDLIINPNNKLSEYNHSNILAILEVLGLNTQKVILGSSLNVSGNATDLLISMVRSVQGTSYLCGGGASGYQEDEKFEKAGIELVYQDYSHPIYPQKGQKAFVSGLSIIDAIMNCGLEGTRSLLLGDGL